ALKTAAEKLGKSETFGALKATASSESFTASASSKAIAGQYNIQVNTLATTQTLVSKGVTDRTQANGQGGTLTITLADGTEQTLDLDGVDTSIDGLISAINSADPSLGVRATVINDGSGAPHRLMLT